MLQHDNKNPPPIKPKPVIAAKPKIPKSSYVIVSGNGKAIVNKTAIHLNKSNNETTREIPFDNPTCSNAGDGKGAIKKNLSVNNGNGNSLPLSPNMSIICANDCCGILNNKEMASQRNNEKNDTQNGIADENNKLNLVSKKLKTPSDSFDSSLSSSSGGFKDHDFLVKTKIAYEIYDREDNLVQHPRKPESPPATNNINHSKIHEIQSKLLTAQQENLQHKTTNAEHFSNIQQSSHNNIQKQKKQLEQVLAQRIDKENRLKPILAGVNSALEKSSRRSTQVSFEDKQSQEEVDLNLSKIIAQKLQQEMKQQCQMIKDKFLIERVPVQLHYHDYLVFFTV
jgi:flagellar biosynthesis GTPase FlhF